VLYSFLRLVDHAFLLLPLQLLLERFNPLGGVASVTDPDAASNDELLEERLEPVGPDLDWRATLLEEVLESLVGGLLERGRVPGVPGGFVGLPAGRVKEPICLGVDRLGDCRWHALTPAAVLDTGVGDAQVSGCDLPCSGTLVAALGHAILAVDYVGEVQDLVVDDELWSIAAGLLEVPRAPSRLELVHCLELADALDATFKQLWVLRFPSFELLGKELLQECALLLGERLDLVRKAVGFDNLRLSLEVHVRVGPWVHIEVKGRLVELDRALQFLLELCELAQVLA